VANSDLILSIGSRLDNRQTAKRDTFAKKAKLIRIDIDDTEFEYKVKPDELNLHISAQDFIDAIKNQIKIFDKVDEAWIAQIKKWKKAYPFESDDEKALPNKILKKLGKLIPTDAILSVDVGQNQIWAAQSIIHRVSINLWFAVVWVLWDFPFRQQSALILQTKKIP
jgi:acetolactate synthase-1/2/3 large subunit